MATLLLLSGLLPGSLASWWHHAFLLRGCHTPPCGTGPLETAAPAKPILGARSLLHSNVTLKFIHIPKVGGSSIEDFGLRHGHRWGRYDHSGLIEHSEHPKCWSTQYYHGIPTGVKNQSVHTFCVVRDPYERVLSEIRYELTFHGLHGAHYAKCPSAKGLNDLIMKQMNRTIQGRILPCHWIAQYKFVKHCDHVLRMNHLEEDLRALGSHYGAVFDLAGLHSMDDRAKFRSDCKLSTSMFTAETKTALAKEYYIDAALVKMLDANVIRNRERLALAEKLTLLEVSQTAAATTT
mmetsp:Transcript_11789/g.22735  ORF Transcript_11789/g.22735 Transcript_11789/m.22735 type:complete len:293 (-) Transcript_11789:375-1253(-)